MELAEQAYKKSIGLLKQNSSQYGFLAAGKSKQSSLRNYDAIFGRDAMICSLAALASQDKKLIATAKKSFQTLAANISSQGQIPFSVKFIGNKKIIKHRLPQSIDGNLWWLIIYELFKKNSHQDIVKRHGKTAQTAFAWLKTKENFYLLEQGEGADWADEMPRSGLVLYSNALWLLLLRLRNDKNLKNAEKSFKYFFQAEKQDKDLDQIFPWFKKNVKKYINKQDYYLSAVSRVNFDESFDIWGNILTALVGFDSKKIINSIIKSKANYPYPIKALARPINKKQQGIFEKTHQNKKWHYHNAGIWPMIGGWWVYLLVKNNKELARLELEKLAQINKRGNWQFNEWFHGKTGLISGVRFQSWNAATYILAYQALNNNKFLF